MVSSESVPNPGGELSIMLSLGCVKGRGFCDLLGNFPRLHRVLLNLYLPALFLILRCVIPVVLVQ